MCQRRDDLAAGPLVSSQPEYKDQITEAQDVSEVTARGSRPTQGSARLKLAILEFDKLDGIEASTARDPNMREHTRLASASLMAVALNQAAST
ncbi:hypothetical protein E4U14_007253 [Claviceps sp. LM454 group G7]|nr:hypothetical protein E4U14_007253 [Claviceps sp. LM454 group G7]